MNMKSIKQFLIVIFFTIVPVLSPPRLEEIQTLDALKKILNEEVSYFGQIDIATQSSNLSFGSFCTAFGFNANFYAIFNGFYKVEITADDKLVIHWFNIYSSDNKQKIKKGLAYQAPIKDIKGMRVRLPIQESTQLKTLDEDETDLKHLTWVCKNNIEGYGYADTCSIYESQPTEHSIQLDVENASSKNNLDSVVSPPGLEEIQNLDALKKILNEKVSYFGQIDIATQENNITFPNFNTQLTKSNQSYTGHCNGCYKVGITSDNKLVIYWVNIHKSRAVDENKRKVEFEIAYTAPIAQIKELKMKLPIQESIDLIKLKETDLPHLTWVSNGNENSWVYGDKNSLSEAVIENGPEVVLTNTPSKNWLEANPFKSLALLISVLSCTIIYLKKHTPIQKKTKLKRKLTPPKSKHLARKK